jgi:uncharacterized membrane protein YcaP (DUF421 family)
MLRLLIGPDEAAQPWQMMVRAVILLVFGIACIRIAGRRTFSDATPLDIIVAIVVGSNISRIMTGKADFLGGLGASLTIVVLHRLLALATLRWGWLAWAVKGSPVVLVRDGQVDRAALTRHGISEDDLAESLRMEGVDAPKGASLATLESGGKISVVRASKTSQARRR